MPMPSPRGGEELPDGKKVLQQIALETGGRFFEVGRFHYPLDKVFAEIEEDRSWLRKGVSLKARYPRRTSCAGIA